MKHGVRLILFAFSLFFNFLFVSAQITQIKGRVLGEDGFPIIGANIILVGNESNGTITDIEGNFSISAPLNSSLEISFIGYTTKILKLDGKSTYEIVLKEDTKRLDEVVVVGYGAQKKVNLTGAISVVTSDDLNVTKAQDAKNLLTGKIPGVRIVQNTSEPGDFSGNFDIRGYGSRPLIVIDGVPREDFERLNPNDIESISVLKDASAAIYGVRAANGVVLVTTKKGKKDNKAKIEYGMYYGIQTPTEMLKPVDAVNRMILFNEKSMRSLTSPRLTYSDDAIAPYLNGEKFSTDWYAAVMANTAPQQQHNVSISGGSSKVDYYVNLGYMDQKGFLKSNSLDYNRYNFRSNLNAQLTDDLRLSIMLGATIDKRYRPYTRTWEIFKAMSRSVPDETVYVNNNPNYLAKPTSDFNNPVGLMDSDISGHKKEDNKILSSTFEAEYNLKWIKGLKLKGLFSYDYNVNGTEEWRLSYNEYTYNASNDTYVPYMCQNPTNMNRRIGNTWSTLWQTSVNYNNSFAGHNVSGILLYEESHKKSDDIIAIRDFTVPLPYLFAGIYTNQIGTSSINPEFATRALVGRFNYDYLGKYLAEFLFRYDGSSKFPKHSRWGFFPSASIGWRMSEENFIKNNINFIDNLKLRMSYGMMGDDGSSMYQFLGGYNYPNMDGAVINDIPVGYILGNEIYNTLGFRPLPNNNITWYTIKTLNVGLDADLWSGLLGFTFEIFQRQRSGLLASRTSSISGNLGIGLSQDNLESDKTKGFELELRHRNNIDDFFYNINFNLSMTRTLLMDVVSAPYSNSYDNWRNNNSDRYNDIWFGYSSNGRFENYEQISNSDIFVDNSTLPGDYIYEDWNGDGIIDEMDEHPIATIINSEGEWQNRKNYPLMNFGLNLGAGWKNFDCNLSFQGAGMSYISYGGQLSTPLQFNGNAFEYFMDRWHPIDPKQDPYSPSTEWKSGFYSYGATTPKENSEFAIQKGNYLRLKSAEIGYTIPQKVLQKINIKDLRLFVNAYNLFTLTKVKGVDPEKPAELYGLMYPLNRSYNFGLNITF